LIEAVYRTEVEKVAAAEKKFSATLAPIEALRAWMLLFIDYIATKQIIGPALDSLVGGPSKGSRSNARPFGDVIKAGVRAGPSKRLLRHFQNALAVSPRVGARFSRGKLGATSRYMRRERCGKAVHQSRFIPTTRSAM
jgi:hypothetical protein